MKLAPRLLSDLRRVEEGGNDRRRANADGYAGLDELVAPLFAGPVEFVVHRRFSMVLGARWEAA